MKLLENFFDVEELDERQEGLFQVLNFLLKLLIAGVVFQAILWIYPDTTGLQALLAKVTAFLSDPLIPSSLEVSGIYILSDQARYVITQDCLGWKSASAFIALVFASSERFRDHLGSLVVGTAFILVANLVRIVTTIFLSYRGIISFDIIHDVLWKWSLTFLVLLVWILWYEKVREREPGLWKDLAARIGVQKI